ncbi:DUF422 domain-containing protein [Murdochiella vaginalis]|uniref:DUF422 domain-containing protein n=1 Tax=Murdochiella vaginalis TaxID=1852373 RepID=UPI0008FE9039|nr:DUF422 domain-containing protein [Murdochiella vaginalis]
MNWIQSFELLCYAITLVFFMDLLQNNKRNEFFLFLSAAFAGFALELLAVRLTGIYHYSRDFFIQIGPEPYQFPFFGGLMWGTLAVCSLRIAQKFSLSKVRTALLSGWLIVSFDLLLDVAAIRLNGGFWVWDGRPITLEMNHHLFMSVIWVNFLGYLFETPTVVYLWLAQQEKGEKNLLRALGNAIWIGLAGVGVVGLASAVSLWLDQWSDEWFSFLAFAIIWIAVFIRIILYLVRHRKNIAWETKKDKALLFTWGTLYSYCLAALIELQILQEIPLYALFAISMLGLTLLLSMIRIEQTQEAL